MKMYLTSVIFVDVSFTLGPSHCDMVQKNYKQQKPTRITHKTKNSVFWDVMPRGLVKFSEVSEELIRFTFKVKE
jgi:hypothetical protein